MELPHTIVQVPVDYKESYSLMVVLAVGNVYGDGNGDNSGTTRNN
jgi:hypothetical protein